MRRQSDSSIARGPPLVLGHRPLERGHLLRRVGLVVVVGGLVVGGLKTGMDVVVVAVRGDRSITAPDPLGGGDAVVVLVAVVESSSRGLGSPGRSSGSVVVVDVMALAGAVCTSVARRVQPVTATPTAIPTATTAARRAVTPAPKIRKAPLST